MQDLFIVHSSSLPSSTRVMGFRGEEALSKPYWFEVYVAIDGGAGAAVDPGDVIGTRATLELVQDLLAVPYWFHGVVSEIELIEEQPGRSVFRIRLVPQVGSLELSLHSRVFTKKSIPEILQSVLEDNGFDGEDFELRLTGAYAVEEHVCQYRESDLAFISRWMEHEGMYYFFEQQRSGEKLVITDDVASHSSLLTAPVRYHPSPDDESAKEALHVATLRQSTLGARVIISDYDYIKPALALVGSADVSADGTAEWSVYGDRVFSPEGAKRVATFRAQSLLARKCVLSASGTQRHVRSGYRFELGEHPRGEMNREYLVLSMRHIGRQLHGAPELDELLGEGNERPDVYRIELEAIPSDVQYREPRRTPWPKIHGFENGVIDGAASSTYAQIDEHGRYATKLRFDEGPGKAGTASTWLRMAQPHGGGLEGFHFPLRKGTEVLVQFLDGDPDRPLIAAVLPNAATPSPVTSGNNTKNVMQTGGSTRMEIEDLAGGQYMHNTTPPQNTSMWMGTDATSKGGHNVEASSDGSAGRSFGSYFDRFIGATKAEHVVDEVMRNYDANFSSTVTSNVEQNYSANQDSTIISNVSRNVVGAHTDTVTGVVTRSWQATATHQITDDVNETFQANHALQVQGTQDVHVLAKGDFTQQAGKAETVNGALSKHVATSGYKLEVNPDASFHVVANIGIRADVAAVLSAPDTTVDGDTSVDIVGGSTVDAKSQSVSMIGTSLIKLMSGGKIEITGGEVSIKGGNITVAASAKMTVAAKAQAVAAASGNMTVNGGPMTEVKGGVIQLNLGGASPSGLGPQVDALIALDPTLANKLAELQKAGWVIQYGDPPGGGSYYDKGKKIMVIDGSLRSDPQAAFNELGRLQGSLENPTTPVYAQEESQSCVIASSRMIAETQTGRNIPESDLRAQSTAMGPGGYDPAGGTDMTLGDDLLRENGVSGASEFGPLSIDDLDAATANGDPAMVRLQHAGGGGHAVVVDGVSTAPDGTRMITIRDPGGSGSSQTMPVTQFQNDYYGNGSNTGYDGRGITTNGGG